VQARGLFSEPLELVLPEFVFVIGSAPVDVLFARFYYGSGTAFEDLPAADTIVEAQSAPRGETLFRGRADAWRGWGTR